MCNYVYALQFFYGSILGVHGREMGISQMSLGISSRALIGVSFLNLMGVHGRVLGKWVSISGFQYMKLQVLSPFLLRAMTLSKCL